MRKSFDSLSGIVRDNLELNPLNGSVYIFINKQGDKLKMLHWLDMSFTLYYKRLEEGNFELPVYEQEVVLLKLSYTQLAMIVDGLSIIQIKKRQRYQGNPA